MSTRTMEPQKSRAKQINEQAKQRDVRAVCKSITRKSIEKVIKKQAVKDAKLLEKKQQDMALLAKVQLDLIRVAKKFEAANNRIAQLEATLNADASKATQRIRDLEGQMHDLEDKGLETGTHKDKGKASHLHELQTFDVEPSQSPTGLELRQAWVYSTQGLTLSEAWDLHLQRQKSVKND